MPLNLQWYYLRMVVLISTIAFMVILCTKNILYLYNYVIAVIETWIELYICEFLSSISHKQFTQ